LTKLWSGSYHIAFSTCMLQSYYFGFRWKSAVSLTSCIVISFHVTREVRMCHTEVIFLSSIYTVVSVNDWYLLMFSAVQHTNESGWSLGRGNRFLKLSLCRKHLSYIRHHSDSFLSGGEYSSAVDFAQKITPLNVIKWKYAEELNFKLPVVMKDVTALKAKSCWSMGIVYSVCFFTVYVHVDLYTN
jgi:hypothetical protein